MNLPETSEPASASQQSRGTRRQRTAPPRPGMTRFRGACESREARKVAAAVLEVLAGAATPSDAATSLGVSLPRYYALEGRALEGLLKGCEPRPKGPRKSPQREIERLKAEIERLQREAARSQALLRAAQRSVGLSSLQRRGGKAKPPGKKGRRRRPRARALRAAKLLRMPEEKTVETSTAGEHNDGVEAK